MSISLVSIQLTSALLIFIVMLNGYLRGSLKQALDAVLSVLLVGLLTVTFYWFGWNVGLLTIALYCGYSLVTRPIAKIIAFRLLGYRTTLREETGVHSVEPVLRTENDVEEWIQHLANKKSVTQLLTDYGMSVNDLTELYWTLLAGGVSAEILRSVLLDGQRLSAVLDLRTQHETVERFALKVLDLH